MLCAGCNLANAPFCYKHVTPSESEFKTITCYSGDFYDLGDSASSAE
jgi:hypothetical protein